MDSLQGVILSYEHSFNADSLGKAYYALSIEYQNSAQLDEAIRTLTLASSLSTSDKICFDIHSRLGSFHSQQSQFVEALKYLLIAEKKAVSLHDTLKIDNKSCLAQLYVNVGDYESASTYQYEALLLAEKIGDPKQIIRGYFGLGRIYWYMKNLVEALNFDLKALELAREMGDPNNLFFAISGVASSYSEREELSEAIFYAKEAMNLADSIENASYQAFSYGLVGEILRKQKSLSEAKAYFERSIDKFYTINSQFMLADVYMGYGKLLFEQGFQHVAIDTLQTALDMAKDISYRALEKDLYEELAKCYRQMGQYSKAYESVQLHLALQDSLLNQELLRRIKQLETQYLLNGQDWQIKQMKRKEYRLKWVFGISLVLICLGLLIIFVKHEELKKFLYSLGNSEKGASSLPQSHTELVTDSTVNTEPITNEWREMLGPTKQFFSPSSLDEQSVDFSSIIFEAYRLLPENFQVNIKSIRMHGIPRVKQNGSKICHLLSRLLTFIIENGADSNIFIDVNLEKEAGQPCLLYLLVQYEPRSSLTHSKQSLIPELDVENNQQENLNLFFAKKIIESLDGNFFPLTHLDHQWEIVFSLPRHNFE